MNMLILRSILWVIIVDETADGREHDVTLICRSASAASINRDGTEVRIKLRDEDEHQCHSVG